ncbi:unnamed protein product [Linum trigynum]|uniref:Uncharacterized protein n=1 Tax=Linum trigynum TaxID=586398 RepID=A0AAV2EX86_9ROSI
MGATPSDAQDTRAIEDAKITRRPNRPRLTLTAPITVNSAETDGIAQIRVSHTKIKQVAFAEYPLMGGNCWACDSDLTTLKKHPRILTPESSARVKTTPGGRAQTLNDDALDRRGPLLRSRRSAAASSNG